MPLNRRSFLKTVGLLAAVPFVPISVFHKLAKNPYLCPNFICHKSNAKTFKELHGEIYRRANGKFPGSTYFNNDSKCHVFLLPSSKYNSIISEIPKHEKFSYDHITEKGFEHFIDYGFAILRG